MQQLEFLNILKEFKVLIKPLAVIQDNQWLVILVCILGILLYIENKKKKKYKKKIVIVKLNMGQCLMLHVRF